MSITVSKYTTFEELRCLLNDIDNAFFIVPTSQDNDWLLDLAGQNLFTDYTTYVWNDLYRVLASRTGAADGKTAVFRQIDPPDNRLILRYVLNEFIKKKPEIKIELPGIVHSGYIDMLSESIGEFISEEVSPETLELADLNFDLTQQILMEFYKEYLDYLDRNGLMDSAQIPTRARELIEENKINLNQDNFVFVGYLSFTNAQKNLIESMSNSGANISLLQPEAFVDGIYDASLQFVKYKRNDDNNSLNHNVDYYLFESPDSLCELDLLSRELALWNSGLGAFAEHPFRGWDSTGVLTSRDRVGMLHNALARYNIPVNLYTGKRVCETPLGYLPKKIFRAYKNGWQAKDTTILLSHICLGGSMLEPEAMYRGPGSENSWIKHMSGSHNDVGIKAFKAMNKFCRAIDKGGNPVAILQALLEFSGETGLWLDSLQLTTAEDKEGVFDSCLRELASAIIELERKLLFMKELQPSVGAAGNQIFKGYAAIEYINQWVEETQTATNPVISGAISVYSKIPALAYFDSLIITGVTAKEWPGDLSKSSIISESVRERINEYNPGQKLKATHMMTIHEKRIQKEALLKRLFYSVERFIVVSRPLADDKNRPLPASPCLSSALTSKDFVNRGVIRKDFSDLMPENSPYFGKIEIRPGYKGMNKRDIPRAFSANNKKISISALHELVECPFFYWARYIKKIKEPVTELYNSLYAGNLVHDIMEASWKEKIESGVHLSEIVSALWERIENDDNYRLASKYTDLFTDKRLARRKNLLRTRIVKTAELQDEIEGRMSVYDKKRLDIKFEYDISFDVEELNFAGRCDRLDIFSDGAVIIDYKTGKIPDNMLQLGAYAKALEQNGIEFIGAGFVSLTEEKLAGVFNTPYSLIYTGREVKKSIEGLVNDAEREINSAKEIIRSGEFRPNYNSQLCRYCSYKPICRHAEFGDDFAEEEEE